MSPPCVNFFCTFLLSIPQLDRNFKIAYAYKEACLENEKAIEETLLTSFLT